VAEATVETIYLNVGLQARPVRVRREGQTLGLSFGYSKTLVAEVKALRGARWHPQEGCTACSPACKWRKSWTVSDCSRNRIQLALLQGQLPPELARYEVPLLDVKPRRPLWAHQVAMFRHGVTRRRCILAAEQGTGKTQSAIEIMEYAAAHGFTDWWWVSPKNVQPANRLEFAKWGCTVTPRMVHYDILARELEARFRCRSCNEVMVESRTRDADGNLCCRECGTVAPGFERLPDQPAPHGVVYDESVFAKSPGSRRSRACQLLADAVREEHDGYVIEMCGIPAPKDPCDWFSQAEIACPGFLRESNVGALRRRLANIETIQGPEHAFPKIVSWKRDEVELLKRRLDGLVQVHLARDCQDLPELRKEIVRLEPSAEMRRAAKLVGATASTAVEALNKLRQLSDGFQYRASGSAARAATPKDAALADLLARCEETGRVIVYAGFHESVDRCTEVCVAEGWSVLQIDGRGQKLIGVPPDWTWERGLKELDRATDSGEVEKLAFVAHPRSGGIGLNLTACPASVYFSVDFDYSTFGQSLKRGHRAGMDVERGFTAYFLCHLGTDEYVLRNLENKREMQSWSLEEVKAAL
jgi:hypothetical protein